MPLGGCGPNTLADCTVARQRGGRAREKGLERSRGQVPEIVLGSCKNTPCTELGKVVRGLLLPDGDTIPHATEIFTNWFQPPGIFEEGLNTFQDHEARAEHPAHLDDMENDLPPGVPIHPVSTLFLLVSPIFLF